MARCALIAIRLVAVALRLIPILWGVWCVAGCSKNGDEVTHKSPPEVRQFTRQNCHFYTQIPGVQIDCGALDIAVEQRHYRLPVTRITPHSSAADAVPLVYFAGGPGAGVSVDGDSIYSWIGWLERTKLKRPLILFDRRGTGYSTPRWHCGEFDRKSSQWLQQDLSTETEMAQGKEVLDRCLKRLQRRNYHPDDFSTRHSSEDAKFILSALGYSRWLVYGVSYGSRLALIHAEQYPEQVAGLVLDSAYPPEQGGLEQWAKQLDDGLTLLLDKCDLDIRCSRGGSSRTKLERQLERLAQTPLEMEIDHWEGSAVIPVKLNASRYLAALRASLYQRERWTLIGHALDGETEAIRGIVTSFINSALDRNFSYWSYFAIECRENALPANPEQLERSWAQQYPHWFKYLNGTARYSICYHPAFMPQAALKASTIAPSIPTTILGGALDPITPWHWSDGLAAHAKRWRFSGIGHAVLGNSDCAAAHLEPLLQAQLTGVEATLETCGAVRIDAAGK